MAALVTRDALLGAMRETAATPPKLVKIKGFGEVYVREITIGEVDSQIADTADKKNKAGVARGACRLLCDASGTRLLDPDNAEDVAEMAKQPLRILTAINSASDFDKAEEPGN
jgi:hypothetical protein